MIGSFSSIGLIRSEFSKERETFLKWSHENNLIVLHQQPLVDPVPPPFTFQEIHCGFNQPQHWFAYILNLKSFSILALAFSLKATKICCWRFCNRNSDFYFSCLFFLPEEQDEVWHSLLFISALCCCAKSKCRDLFIKCVWFQGMHGAEGCGRRWCLQELCVALVFAVACVTHTHCLWIGLKTDIADIFKAFKAKIQLKPVPKSDPSVPCSSWPHFDQTLVLFQLLYPGQLVHIEGLCVFFFFLQARLIIRLVCEEFRQWWIWELKVLRTLRCFFPHGDCWFCTKTLLLLSKIKRKKNSFPDLFYNLFYNCRVINQKRI